MEQEEKLCDEVETVHESTYFCDRVITGERCEAAVTARTRCGWGKLRECSELLCGNRCPLNMKGTVYMSCVRPAILYEIEAWCLKESGMGILRLTERSLLRAMCEVQLKYRKRSMDLMLILLLSRYVVGDWGIGV